MMKKKQPIFLWAALSVAALVASGCGGENTAKKPASQVAAKVNRGEITVHQINGAVSSTNTSASPEQSKQAAAQVLETLIEQELLVQQAAEKKLDRDPKVLQALESTRRQVLAQAALEELSASLPRPAPEEMHRFYVENPLLFAQRRIYRLREIAVVANGDQQPRVGALAGKARTMNEFVGSLKSESLSFTDNMRAVPAEQVPLDLLPRITQLKEDQWLSLPGGAGITVVQVVDSAAAPFAEKQAAPLIEQYLMNQQRLRTAQVELKRLREQAKIEYLGDFQQTSQTERTPQTEPAKAGVDKGLRGLK